MFWPHLLSGSLRSPNVLFCRARRLQRGARALLPLVSMEAAILFGVVLVVMSTAFALPMASLRGGLIVIRDASVLGASILALGLGMLNYVFIVWFVLAGKITGVLMVYGLAPLAAGLLGLVVVRLRANGLRRFACLLCAMSLTLIGLPGYFAFNVAILAAVITAIAFAVGLLPNLRALLNMLDPRL